eukprot:jgi/Psemu1/6792/gm1.6792_g
MTYFGDLNQGQMNNNNNKNTVPNPPSDLQDRLTAPIEVPGPLRLSNTYKSQKEGSDTSRYQGDMTYFCDLNQGQMNNNSKGTDTSRYQGEMAYFGDLDQGQQSDEVNNNNNNNTPQKEGTDSSRYQGDTVYFGNLDWGQMNNNNNNNNNNAASPPDDEDVDDEDANCKIFYAWAFLDRDVSSTEYHYDHLWFHFSRGSVTPFQAFSIADRSMRERNHFGSRKPLSIDEEDGHGSFVVTRSFRSDHSRSQAPLVELRIPDPKVGSSSLSRVMVSPDSSVGRAVDCSSVVTVIHRSLVRFRFRRYAILAELAQLAERTTLNRVVEVEGVTLWPSGLRRNVKAVVLIGGGSNPLDLTLWPSGLRRNVKAVVLIGGGSNPLDTKWTFLVTADADSVFKKRADPTLIEPRVTPSRDAAIVSTTREIHCLPVCLLVDPLAHQRSQRAPSGRDLVLTGTRPVGLESRAAPHIGVAWCLQAAAFAACQEIGPGLSSRERGIAASPHDGVRIFRDPTRWLALLRWFLFPIVHSDLQYSSSPTEHESMNVWRFYAATSLEMNSKLSLTRLDNARRSLSFCSGKGNVAKSRVETPGFRCPTLHFEQAPPQKQNPQQPPTNPPTLFPNYPLRWSLPYLYLPTRNGWQPALEDNKTKNPIFRGESDNDDNQFKFGCKKMSPRQGRKALIAQLGERQTEDLKVLCSIHSQGMSRFAPI